VYLSVIQSPLRRSTRRMVLRKRTIMFMADI
jgi:hypothetical protein